MTSSRFLRFEPLSKRPPAFLVFELLRVLHSSLGKPGSKVDPYHLIVDCAASFALKMALRSIVPLPADLDAVCLLPTMGPFMRPSGCRSQLLELLAQGRSRFCFFHLHAKAQDVISCCQQHLLPFVMWMQPDYGWRRYVDVAYVQFSIYFSCYKAIGCAEPYRSIYYTALFVGILLFLNACRLCKRPAEGRLKPTCMNAFRCCLL